MTLSRESSNWKQAQAHYKVTTAAKKEKENHENPQDVGQT